MCENCGIWGASDSSSVPFELSEEDATFRAGAPWALSPDSVLLDVTPEVWHELRMTGYPHALVAYCPCGWAVADGYWSSDMRDFRESYKDHL